MARQDAPRKLCTCGRGYILTSRDRGGEYNEKVDGKTVCLDCKMDAIYADARKKISDTQEG